MSHRTPSLYAAWVAASLAAVSALDCGAVSSATPSDSERNGKAAPASTTSAVTAASEVEPTTHVAVVEPEVVKQLEARGFGLAKMVSNVDAHSTEELSRIPAWKGILDVLAADVRDTARPYPLARVTSVDGFRSFDAGWFDSKEMSFELVGVFNRLDRRAFYQGGCGQTRFVYRLAYTTEQGGALMASRLPMTVNAVFAVSDEGGCRKVAKAWQSKGELEGDALVDWLLKGPLAPEMQRRWSLESVETNVQNIRLQSSVHPTLAGHIEYGMHVFHPVDASRSAFAAAPMENMPDVEALEKKPALRAELLRHLSQPDVLRAIDRGTLRLPDRFVARHATSVSPRGLGRLGNRPFRRLFRDDDFAGVDLGAYATIRSPAALVRRLDGASCTGCHQSRSIAGFHFVGRDADDAPLFESLESGASTHLTADLERRRAYVAALARGAEPEESRPIPERQGTGNAYGAPCGLGDPGFADWTCADGFHCTRLEDAEVGACFAGDEVGEPCEHGTMLPGTTPNKDYVTGITRSACAASLQCDKNPAGFPLGSCEGTCSSDAKGGACGDFLDVDGFQACLRQRRPVDRCAKDFVFTTGLRACNETSPCRQDYVCAGTKRAGEGACVPPYFVFPLRLDGYPIQR